ncbi:hypothetical protein PR048_017910 [Dryococelus australis]|uniref:Uncharacterized protein n=1 Tax=Dryococelus australis TaxID=614101 RepID=A0ABQ9HAY2_9NEOP|nr:hypothetical protein PR048_017910 [Dryococelus australis]
MEQRRNERVWVSRDIPEETRRPASSSGAIPTSGNPGVTRPGIEPGSAWLTAQPPRPLQRTKDEHLVYNRARWADLRGAVDCAPAYGARSSGFEFRTAFKSAHFIVNSPKQVCDTDIGNNENDEYVWIFYGESNPVRLGGMQVIWLLHTPARPREEPRENPSTSCIVQHDYHVRKLVSDPANNRTRFVLVGSSHSGHAYPLAFVTSRRGSHGKLRGRPNKDDGTQKPMPGVKPVCGDGTGRTRAYSRWDAPLGILDANKLVSAVIPSPVCRPTVSGRAATRQPRVRCVSWITRRWKCRRTLKGRQIHTNETVRTMKTEQKKIKSYLGEAIATFREPAYVLDSRQSVEDC